MSAKRYRFHFVDTMDEVLKIRPRHGTREKEEKTEEEMIGFFTETSRKRLIAGIAVFIAALFIFSCAHKAVPPPALPQPPARAGFPKPYRIGNKWYQPLPDARGFREEGVASWYGADFHGKKTSSGEIYDMFGMTAAHKTLPLGTLVSVCNKENGRCIQVRVNDRGPLSGAAS